MKTFLISYDLILDEDTINVSNQSVTGVDVLHALESLSNLLFSSYPSSRNVEATNVKVVERVERYLVDKSRTLLSDKIGDRVIHSILKNRTSLETSTRLIFVEEVNCNYYLYFNLEDLILSFNSTDIKGCAFFSDVNVFEDYLQGKFIDDVILKSITLWANEFIAGRFIELSEELALEALDDAWEQYSSDYDINFYLEGSDVRATVYKVVEGKVHTNNYINLRLGEVK